MLKSVTVDSISCWLVASEPTGSVKWTISRLTHILEGKTRIEERRPLGASLRCKLDWQSPVMDPTEAAAIRIAMREASNRPVLCPLWPAVTQYGTARLATSGLYITFEPDFTTYQIHKTATVSGWTPSSAARTCPLLWGRWGKQPDKLLDQHAEQFIGAFSFVETGPEAAPASYAITPVATVQAGPSINGETPPLIAFDHDYSPKLSADIVIERERMGYGRTEAETFHPHTPRATMSMNITGIASDMMRLVAAFNQVAGNVGTVWFPSALAPCRLTANPTAGNTITVDNAAALGAHPYICLRNFYTGDFPRKINTIAGNTLTLDSSPGVMDYKAVSLQLLYLGRFRSDEISITFTSCTDFTAQVSLEELPTDYSAPSGEIYGSSYGSLAPVVYLLKATDQVGGAWYWTNYESAVTVNSQTWTPKQWQWDQIDEGLNLDDGEVKFKMDAWSGNPFLRLLVPMRGRQIKVELYEWDMTAASATLLWSGTARSARATGKALEVSPKGDGSILDQRIPRLLDNPTCSHIIYDANCGLTPASKAKPGTIASQPSTYVVRVNLTGSPTVAAHFFAGGWMARAVPGVGSPTYAILDSVVVSQGVADITLDAPLSPAMTAGEAVTLYPGCDCTRASCLAHGNFARFGGSPEKPDESPAFAQMKTNNKAKK